jgi:hypothetical protein
MFIYLMKTYILYRAGLKGWPTGQLLGVPTYEYKGHYDITRINANMVLVNLGFHVQNNFSENYLQFGHMPSKNFSSPVIGRKSLKNISFKGLQIIYLPRVATCLGPALIL